jgi:hypothetical protein
MSCQVINFDDTFTIVVADPIIPENNPTFQPSVKVQTGVAILAPE